MNAIIDKATAVAARWQGATDPHVKQMFLDVQASREICLTGSPAHQVEVAWAHLRRVAEMHEEE